jgi:hypothetical protein
MHPLILVLPAIIILTGIVMFVLLPLELPLRLTILGSDLIAALVVGIALARRHRPK